MTGRGHSSATRSSMRGRVWFLKFFGSNMYSASQSFLLNSCLCRPMIPKRCRCAWVDSNYGNRAIQRRPVANERSRWQCRVKQLPKADFNRCEVWCYLTLDFRCGARAAAINDERRMMKNMLPRRHLQGVVRFRRGLIIVCNFIQSVGCVL